MKEKWKIEIEGTHELAIEHSDIVITTRGTNAAVIAFDDRSAPRWRHAVSRLPGDLHVTSGRAVLSLYARNAPEQVIALDTATGDEAWRYERAWGLARQGISVDAGEVLLVGRDIDADRDRRVVLDGLRGAVLADIEAPALTSTARLTGRWCLAKLDRGKAGLLRTDRRGGEPTVLTTTAHVPFSSNGDVVVLDTHGYEGQAALVVIDIETGAERWRTTSGPNLEIAIDASRVAHVDADRSPVVRDLATGAEIWRGDPLPPIGSDDAFETKLGDRGLVCYGGLRHVSVFSFGSRSPIVHREYRRDSTSSSTVVGTTYYEVSYFGVTAWELA